jgi:hypothetical protein
MIALGATMLLVAWLVAREYARRELAVRGPAAAAVAGA